MKTLRDWLPSGQYNEDMDKHLTKHLDVKVVEEHGYMKGNGKHQFPHRNIYNWCLLENGMAVGWNENPSRGWSFPIMNTKNWRKI